MTETNRNRNRTKVQALLIQHPDCVPIKVHTSLPLPKTKYLVPENYTLSQFNLLLRKYLHIKESDILFIFVHNIIPTGTTTVRSLYNQYICTEDYMLHMYCEQENVFG